MVMLDPVKTVFNITENDFIEHLRKTNTLDDLQLLHYTQTRTKRPADGTMKVLWDLGLVSNKILAKQLATLLRVDYAEQTREYRLSSDVFKVDILKGIHIGVIPVLNKQDKLTFLLFNPMDGDAVQLMIDWADDREFGVAITTQDQFEYFVENDSYLSSTKYNRPMVKSGDELRTLFDKIISDALSQRASDIRIFQLKDSGVIVFRIDGDLYPYMHISREEQARLCEQIEGSNFVVVNDTNANSTRSGELRMPLGDRLVEARCSFLPTKHGTDLNLRFMDTSILDISALGLMPNREELLRTIKNFDRGLILITGSTGSGKSATLYSILADAMKGNTICTIEDPVEHDLPGAAQVSVTPDTPYTKVIADFLIHDPDIIVVAETRKRPVAKAVFEAAVTGHLVLTTTHTNDSLSSIERLRSLGIKDEQLASELLYVIAQQLLKRVCPKCSKPVVITADELQERLGKQILKYLDGKESFELLEGEGCEYCNGRGTYGRCAATEIVKVDKELRRMILEHDSVFDLQESHKNKMLTFDEEIVYHLLTGMIPLSEAERGLKVKLL